MAKKILLTKNDSVETAVIKLLKCKEDEVVLVIPNFSQLSHSLENFQLLKKEADETGKNLTIESVDDMVVELAKRSDLEAKNPFFAEKKKIKPLEPEATLVVEKEIKKMDDSEPTSEFSDEELAIEQLPHTKSRRGIYIALAILIIIGVPGGYIAYAVLPRATIEITTKKMDWNHEETVVVDKTASGINASLGILPGQIFSQTKNGQISFPASGQKKTLTKAVGVVTIYNNFGPTAQQLVASTRLETPDGKIFRIKEPVLIPGVKTVGGKTISGSVNVAVIADRGGSEYNIGPTTFTIPGFKNNQAKFKGFTADSVEAMKGGANGIVAYPTDNDIKEAKSKAAETVKEGLRMLINNQIPKEFKTAPNSEKFSVLKQTIATEVNEKNEFTVFIDAEMSIMAFRDSDVMAIINEKIKEELAADLRIKKSTLEYGQAKFDNAKGIMNIPVVFKSKLEYPVDETRLKEQIVNKSKTELKAFLFSMPNLTKVDIKLWPLWVSRVPKAIKLTIE